MRTGIKEYRSKITCEFILNKVENNAVVIDFQELFQKHQSSSNDLVILI